MTHADIQNRMAEYLEGDLALERRALFDAHLDGCEECSSELSELRSTIGLLRALPDVEAPPQLANDVMRRIRLGEATPTGFARAGEFIRDLFAPGIAVPAGAMVAAFALAVSNGQFQMPLGPSQARLPESASIQLSPIPREAQASAERAFATTLKAVRAPSAVVGIQPSFVASRPPTVFQVTPAATGSVAGTAPEVRIVVRRSPGSAFAAGGQRTPRSVDDWLAVVLQKPSEFAQRQASLSLAEREHWVRALARRAVERGVAEDVVRSLETSFRPEATMLSKAFAAQAELASAQIATSR